MKGHFPNDSAMAIIQASAFYDHNLFGTSENPDKASCGPGKNLTVSNSSSGSSPSSSNSNGLTCQATANYGLSEEGHSLISFKPEFGDLVHGNGGILSFEQSRRDMHRCLFTQKMREEEQQDEEYQIWEENLHHSSGFHSQLTNPKYTYTADGRPETCTSHRGGGVGEYSSGEGRFSFLNVQEGCVMDDGVMGRQEDSNNKRPLMVEREQAPKKQSPASKKPKLKLASVPLKDLQSVAAKNRRERISERLKILQDLVPNGSKVDLVTMLEKAISYVKFLQLQVKVLATDEFWPAQGGKAPDLGQVREAIDAILASNRDRISSSSSK